MGTEEDTLAALFQIENNILYKRPPDRIKAMTGISKITSSVPSSLLNDLKCLALPPNKKSRQKFINAG